jgi:hypothetical protein
MTNCMAGGCDGFGKCKPAPAGTACSGYTCTNGVEATSPPGQWLPPSRSQKQCDGVTPSSAGCVAGTNVGCPGGLICADGVSCKPSCSLDIDCVTGYFCNGGVCSMWLALGAPCAAHRQCASHLCLSGTCQECESANDCPPTAPTCNTTTHRCQCNSSCGPTTSCNPSDFSPLCPMQRQPNCPSGTCACSASIASCPSGTICEEEGSTYRCIVPENMPCVSNMDCYGATGCVNGLCQFYPGMSSCAHNNDCPSGYFCCTGYGQGVTACATTCGG